MGDTVVGVVSDIHGNLPALEAVMNDMPRVDYVLCAGDIVGMLGWNAECVDLVSNECSDTVFGNHDARVRTDFAFAPSFPAAQDEMRVVSRQLDEERVQWLSSLPDRVETSRYILAHARPFYFRDPGYPCHGFAQGDRGVLPRDFTTVGPHLDGKTALLGHTHEQHAVNCDNFEGQSGLVVNPGSVGVPFYEPAEYAVVNLDTQEYDLRQAEYDVSFVEDRLDAVGLDPDDYIESQYR